MALLSPGVQVSVTDKSIYIPAAATTVPLFFIATKYGKTLPNTNVIAQGTIEAGVPRLITSLRESIDLYGVPVFYRDVYGQPHHGDARNEYGLFALNQFLRLGNRAYVIRADVDLDDDIENLQNLWTQATDAVVNKSASLFQAFLTSVADVLPGTTTLGGYVPRNTVGFESEHSRVRAENVMMQTIAQTAVKELSKQTSTFADRYPTSRMYNISNVLAGNFYDVENVTLENGSNVFTYEPYRENTDPANTGQDTLYNLLVSTGARYDQSRVLTSPATAFIPRKSTTDPLMFLGIGGEINRRVRSTLVGGNITGAASTNPVLLTASDLSPATTAADTYTSISVTGDVLHITPVTDTSGVIQYYTCRVNFTLMAAASKNSASVGTLKGNGIGYVTYVPANAGNPTATPPVPSTPAVIKLNDNVSFDLSIIRTQNNVDTVVVSGINYTLARPAIDDTALFPLTAQNSDFVFNGVVSIDNAVMPRYVSNANPYGGVNLAEFKTLVRTACEQYIRTYSWFNATHPKAKLAATANNTDAVRRQEIVLRLSQIIKSNTTVNYDVSSQYDDVSDITSEAYEFNLILCPGYPELVDEMLELSGRVKQEAFVIADTPMDKSPRDVIKWGQAADENTIISSAANIRSDDRGLVAYYYPHGIASNLDGYDVLCAASGIALCAFTYSDSVGGVWASPAGPNRGNVSGTIGVNQVGYVSGTLGTSNVQFNRVRLNDGLRDSLFSLCNINPIIDSTQFGISVWAQKTRVNLAFFSSLDRINVARTVMFIRRGVRKMMMRYLEENNTETVRKSITSTVSSYLHDIKIKDGLYDFAVLCDDSNNTPDTIDRNELYVQIALKPVKAIEFIYVPITLVKTGDSLTG